MTTRNRRHYANRSHLYAQLFTFAITVVVSLVVNALATGKTTSAPLAIVFLVIATVFGACWLQAHKVSERIEARVHNAVVRTLGPRR